MNPLFVEGARLLTPVIVEAVKGLPAAQLARYGLVKGSMSTLGPLLGGALGGALVMAVALPGSRRWMMNGSTRVLRELKNTAEKGYETLLDSLLNDPAPPAVAEMP
jgi:hypothetical protein